MHHLPGIGRLAARLDGVHRHDPQVAGWHGHAAASALRGDVAGVVASEVLAVSVEELPEAGTGWTSDPELGLSFRVAKA